MPNSNNVETNFLDDEVKDSSNILETSYSSPSIEILESDNYFSKNEGGEKNKLTLNY